MKTENEMEPSKLICALMYADGITAEKALTMLEDRFGSVQSESGIYCMDDFTDYYRREMGPDLSKLILAFERGPEPDSLAEIKNTTCKIEEELSVRNVDGSTARRVNLDPGFLTPSKLVLASTKCYSHRIYLGKGVFGDLTLLYEKGAFKFLEWTYPDYKSETVLRFLAGVRKTLLE